jgi:hypothetical protein
MVRRESIDSRGAGSGHDWFVRASVALQEKVDAAFERQAFEKLADWRPILGGAVTEQGDEGDFAPIEVCGARFQPTARAFGQRLVAVGREHDQVRLGDITKADFPAVAGLKAIEIEQRPGHAKLGGESQNKPMIKL